MSIGRLLAAGKSMAAGQVGGRYRMDKRMLLPKFGAGKNPFAAPAPVGRSVAAVVKTPPPSPTPTVTAPNEAEPTVIAPTEAAPSPEAPVASIGNVATTVGDMRQMRIVPKIVDAAAKAPRVVGAQAVRAAQWVGEWGQKLNPLPLLARRRGPVKSAADTFKQAPVQAELSLDAVQVVRNDLNDSDLEVVLVTRPIEPSAKEQLVMAGAGAASRGSALNRMTEWVFGPKS